MSDVVKVEVDIRAKDNTSSGVKAAERSFNSLEKSIARTERQIARIEGRHKVDIDANDMATDKLHRVENAMDEVSGNRANVDVEANDMATDVIHSAMSAAEELNGMSAEADLEANDMATDTIHGAEQEVDTFDGMSGEADLEANDMATDVIHSAEQAVDTFAGTEGNATIGANDEASSVIDGATAKAQTWANSTFTAAIGILGVTAGITDTVNTYKDFQATMSEVKAISGATNQDMLELTESAKQYGATTKFTATESAEAFKYMAQAGWKVSEMQAGIGGILNLAAAAGEDLGTTSDIVTDALTAFGYKASDATHFADVLAQAAAASNTDVSKMGETFKYVGSMAGALGYSIEDVGIASGLMANSGLKSSMAGTSMNEIFTRLATNTNGATDSIKALGIEFYNADGSARDWLDIMTELRTATADFTDEQKAEFATTVAGTSAQKGLLAILNAEDAAYNDLVDAIYNADGAAQQMSETMMDNLSGSITLFQSALEGVKDTLGERTEPYLRSAIDGLTELMPEASEKVNAFMNSFDLAVEKMTSSDAWKNADFLGKVDIPFEELIGTPFLDWVTCSGSAMFAEGLNSLFGNAAEIFPGGEQATLSSWLSAGLLGIGASKLISGSRKIVSALTPIANGIKTISTLAKDATSLSGFASGLAGIVSPAGLAVAGITAAAGAIIAITAAVKDYNEGLKEVSLEEHFGNISLSDTQAQALAKDILDQQYLVNVEYALNEVKNAEEFRLQAEAALNENNVLEFKGRVGVKLTPDEQRMYMDNIDKFIENKLREIETRPFSAYIHVQTYLGGTEEGQTLEDNILEWARADHLELTELSKDLQTAVEKALTDGIIDVNEEQAISALQNKISSITARWNEAENQAGWDWINQEYGQLNAADLESGSFTKLLGSSHEQYEAAMAKVQEDSTNWYAELRSMEAAGRIDDAQYYIDESESYIRGQKGKELKNILDLGSNTLGSVYDDVIGENTERIHSMGGGQTISQLNTLAEQGDIGSMLEQGLFTTNRAFMSEHGGADRKAALSLYEEMKPDVGLMESLIDQYISEGEKVPQILMDSYNQAIETGAALGDYDAAWQNYANYIMESGNQALVDMLTNPDNEMYETIRSQLPPELRSAIDRAAAETTDEEVTLEGLKAAALGEVDIDKDLWISKLNEALGDLGTAEEMTAEGATIKVKSGECLWEIGEALNIDWKTIAEENGIEDPYIIYPDMLLKIPLDTLTTEVDGENATAAIDQAMEALTAEGAEFSVTADGVTVDLTNVEVDSETAMAQIEAALGLEEGTLTSNNIEVATGASVTVPSELVTVDTSGIEGAISSATAENTETDPINVESDVNANTGEVNTDDARAQAEEEIESAMGEEYPVDANTAVTLTQTNNVDQIYSECDSDIQNKFNTGFATDASVAITLEWHITNPTASIDVTANGGTATATIKPAVSANGRFVDSPLLSWIGEAGPEYVIPVSPGKRSRGFDLWMQAGEDLGAFNEVAKNADGGYVENGKEYSLRTPFDKKENGVWSINGEKETVVTDPSMTFGNSADSEGNNNTTVNVSLAPVFKIEGKDLDENKVFSVVQERIRELADDIGDEIAEKMEQIFGNMPIAKGA